MLGIFLLLALVGSNSTQVEIPEKVSEISICGNLSGVSLTVGRSQKRALKVSGVEPFIIHEGEKIELQINVEKKNLLNFFGLDRKPVDIKIPVGVPVVLALEGNGSDFVVNAKDILFKRLDISVGSGSVVLSLKDENPLSMDLLRVSVSLGNVKIFGLGHFHARVIELDCGAGKLEASLEGSWKGLEEFTLFSTVGKIELQKPKDISIRLLKSGILNLGAKSFLSGEKILKIRFKGSINKFEIKEVR